MRRPPDRNVALSKKCQNCGGTFVPDGNRARFCSTHCLLDGLSKPDPSGCRLWVGLIMKNGYGQVPRTRGDKRTRLPHRLAYEEYIGPVPSDFFVCHKCDVRNCINPDHLFLGTQADNMRDCAVKGRNARKLSEEDVRQIRSIIGVSKAELGRLYGVAETMIGVILREIWWKDVANEKTLDQEKIIAD